MNDADPSERWGNLFRALPGMAEDAKARALSKLGAKRRPEVLFCALCSEPHAASADGAPIVKEPSGPMVCAECQEKVESGWTGFLCATTREVAWLKLPAGHPWIGKVKMVPPEKMAELQKAIEARDAGTGDAKEEEGR